MTTLRPYQSDAVDKTLSLWSESDTVLGVLPTGMGKTVVFAEVLRRRASARSIVLAHRQELIWQARDKIRAFGGLGVEVEMGEHKAAAGDGLWQRSQVVVSTIQTCAAGGDGGGRMGKFDPMDFGTLVVDEAHHATSPSYRRVIDYFRSNPKLKVLGVTATPDRSDEEALGQVFEEVAFDYEILDAINDGWLVPINQMLVSVGGIDLSSVRTTAGDLNGADLSKVMESEKNLHGVAGPTIEIVGSKRALVFTASVEQAKQLAEIFNRHRAGMAAWVCGATDKDERAMMLRKFQRGEIQIVCNCNVLTEGFDDPGVEVVVQARPTKSRALYAQIIGRSTRPLPGIVDGPKTPMGRRCAIGKSAKPGCLVVDFVGNSGKHKLVTTADILGGNVSDEAVESACLAARKTGRPVDMRDALRDAEEELEREAARLESEARRAKIVASAKFNTTSVNPFDLLGIRPVKSRGWDQGKTLSEGQSAMLRRNGIDPDAISYSEGKQLLNAIGQRITEQKCSLGQMKVLRKFGVSTDVSFKHASKIIDAIAKNGWKRPAVLPSEGVPVGDANVIEADDDVPF